MSDEEDDDYDEEDDEGEEEEEQEEEEGGENDANKQANVERDKKILLDIKDYIDRVRDRMKRALLDKMKMNELEASLERALSEGEESNRRPQRHSEEPDLNWEEYENLDDAQRALLLERAIRVLADDRSEMPAAYGLKGKKKY